MTKPSPFAYLIALLAALLATSCLDLRETDPCRTLALAICSKQCRGNHELCVSTYQHGCYASDWSTHHIDACTHDLAPLEHCAGIAAVQKACPLYGPLPLLGAACESECGELECSENVCTKACVSDGDCSELLTSDGRAAYCGIYECHESCDSDRDCRSDLACVTRPDGIALCDLRPYHPQPPQKLGDNCSTKDQCDAATSDTCLFGYCSKRCASDDDCAAPNSLGLPSVCMGLADRAFCQPSCATDDDCAPRQCSPATSLAGTPAQVCAAKRGPGLVGDACQSSAACVDPGASCNVVCVVPCATDADCPQQTITGGPARCTQRSSTERVCLPACDGPGVECSVGECVRIADKTHVCTP